MGSFWHATTIVGCRHKGQVAMAGDGQVTLDKVVMKKGARKIRRMASGKVLAGFAGSAADGVTLYEKFEGRLEEYRNNLVRAAVEMAKDWRTDRMLRRLEALLIVADAEHLLVLSGTGDIIEPDDGVVAIGSGGSYALAAARGLMRHSPLTAEEIVKESLSIAADICIYTNHDIVVEVL